MPRYQSAATGRPWRTSSSTTPSWSASLEALLDRFNLFEALGVARQELRHSDFLGFLLNPQQPHSLGDFFLEAVPAASAGREPGRRPADLADRPGRVEPDRHPRPARVEPDRPPAGERDPSPDRADREQDRHRGALEPALPLPCGRPAEAYPGYDPVALFLTPKAICPPSRATCR